MVAIINYDNDGNFDGNFDDILTTITWSKNDQRNLGMGTTHWVDPSHHSGNARK